MTITFLIANLRCIFGPGAVFSLCSSQCQCSSPPSKPPQKKKKGQKAIKNPGSNSIWTPISKALLKCCPRECTNSISLSHVASGSSNNKSTSSKCFGSASYQLKTTSCCWMLETYTCQSIHLLILQWLLLCCYLNSCLIAVSETQHDLQMLET